MVQGRGLSALMVGIFIVAILAFLVCSCAEIFRANQNAPPDYRHAPGEGDPTQKKKVIAILDESAIQEIDDLLKMG
jgi:hypothetical protein